LSTEAHDADKPFDLEEMAKQPLPELDATPEKKGQYTLANWAVQDDHYRGLSQQWSKAILFIVGKHWNIMNERSGVYEPDVDVPAWRQQPTTNITFAVFRAYIAKLLKNRPTTDVVPPSGDSEDREAALLGEAVLQFFWRYLKTPQTLKRAVAWFVATGNVYFNVDWDEDAGKLKPRTVLVEHPNPDHDPNDPLSDETVDVECACDENGEAHRRDPEDGESPAYDGGRPYDFDREPDVEPEGEVDLSIDDPFSVRYNADATTPEDATEWFIGRLWPKTTAAQAFDISVADIGPGNDAEGERELIDDHLSRLTSGAPDPFRSPLSGRPGTDQSLGIGPRVLVLYYYHKPDAKAGYPKGRHWITIGDKKVWPKENDSEYPNGEAPLPFGFWPPRVPLIDTPVPGQPQGIGVITQITGLNEQMDVLDGKVMENHVTMAMGGVWFVAPEDKGMVITSEPGQVKVSKSMGIRGRAGAPFQAQLQAMPEQVYRERDVIQNKVLTVSGLSQMDLSQRPEGVSAGRAFLVLQEASDAAVMPSIMALETAIEEIGRRELAVVQQKYTEERTIQIRGDRGRAEFRSFKGSDLRDGLDVRVQAGSSAPWSKSAQLDIKLSTIQAVPQLVLKPDNSVDMQKFEKFMDVGATGLSAFASDEDPDLVEIEREHSMFEAYDPSKGSNELPQLAFWQTHPIHLKQHYDFMKRSRNRFNRWSPDAQQAFLNHMQETAQAIEEMVGQLQTAAPPGGAPGQPGQQGAPPDAQGGAPDGAAAAGGAAPGAPGGQPPMQLGSGASSNGAPGGQAMLTRSDFAAAH
jgi:hypothetical protein